MPLFLRGAIFTQFDLSRGHAAALVGHIRIVPSGGVNVGMAEHVRDQIDIARFLIEVCTKG